MSMRVPVSLQVSGMGGMWGGVHVCRPGCTHMACKHGLVCVQTRPCPRPKPYLTLSRWLPASPGDGCW